MTDKDIIICGHGWGRPSTKNLNQYATQRYNQIASNGKHKGIVEVRRLKAMTDAGRKKFHDTYKNILGRNYYDQDLREYVYTPYRNGRYYSDCSSSICSTYKKIGYSCSLLNTAGIHNSSLFETVNAKIVNGHITNPEVLKVGDCILFVGDDPARPLQIGHVEAVYEINGGSSDNDTVEAFQGFLNEFYPDIVKKCTGSLLSIDGSYGKYTRSAALGVWKHMSNKYYGTHLTIGNDNFYSSCKAAAVHMTEKECDKHSTLRAILQGVLSGRGYYDGQFDLSKYTAVLKPSIKKMTGDEDIDSDMWYSLFN